MPACRKNENQGASAGLMPRAESLTNVSPRHRERFVYLVDRGRLMGDPMPVGRQPHACDLRLLEKHPSGNAFGIFLVLGTKSIMHEFFFRQNVCIFEPNRKGD